jgi:hypothetical protein
MKKIKITKVLELIFSIGLTFFLIIIGTWALPQMPQHIQGVFAFTILGAACYVMFHQLDKLGVL